MSWSFRISLNRPYKSLLAVFGFWKTLLLLLAVFSPGRGYDTSTTLRLNRNATNEDGDGPFIASLRLVSTKLTRWDAIYFTEVASRGYIFEQEWAFGYGFTKLINFFANALQQTGAVDCAFREHIAGIIIAHAAHGLSVLVLYRLGCAIFSGRQGRMLAFVAACLHIFSPAGLFLSAPYGESTYAFLSFTGYFLFVQSFSLSGASTLKDALIPLAGILCGLATTIRGNGILNGLLFLEEAIRLLYSMTRGVTFAKSRRLLAVGIAGVCTALGFVVPQYIAYRDFCVNYPYTHDEEPRIWCRRSLPSIYSFVQDHYWNNGFLRYWTVSNIPLFALASPMLAIMTYSALWTLDVESGRLTGTSRVLRSLAAPQLILAILTFAKHHVQIITRMASGYPVWYFWIADLLMKEYSSVRLDKKEVGSQKQRSYANLAVTYMISYAAVQGVLFASFLPPA
ncbi:ER membrane glycoprotein subunit of the GPI transamidase complex-like protein [Aspergillus viridinutans]|uniref:GPI mannosyltransferase 2 n=1 Tax=Aspergillus viridinutans TaxID=75553 RepID=A0A9P3C6D7_ASPVI|nr:ER membrane glycoprotein subunit of the GPI transamidase complex-like protein [Aspergillus viridinutans]GIK04689.1 ER membrane glycoprotein subunit of the GPI transamidase complex-like protein [Aspergillus viridinutans]